MKNRFSHKTRKIYCNILAAIIVVVTVINALGYSSQKPQISAYVDGNSCPRVADSLHNDFSEPKCATGLDSAAVRQTIIDDVCNGLSPWDDFPPDLKEILKQEHISLVGSNNVVFEHLITETRPKTIIQVGTYLGNSAIHMAKLVKTLGLNAQIICIDDFRPWMKNGSLRKFRAKQIINGDRLFLYKFMLNVFNVNMTNSVMFLPFSTSSGLELLCEMGIYADLVEIDAAHDFHSVWLDINNGYKVLRPGGVLFGHDIGIDSVRNAVNLFARIHGFKIRIECDHWILY